MGMVIKKNPLRCEHPEIVGLTVWLYFWRVCVLLCAPPMCLGVCLGCWLLVCFGDVFAWFVSPLGFLDPEISCFGSEPYFYGLGQ